MRDLADRYEAFCSGLDNFYNTDWGEYEAFVDGLVAGLEFVGSGCTCQVYGSGGLVLKLHTPYGDRMTLLSNPSLELLGRCVGHEEACSETDWNDPRAVRHFLFFEYVTGRGFAAVQRRVDCSEGGQERAYRLFRGMDPMLARFNHLRNMGMDGDRPVYVDWY